MVRDLVVYPPLSCVPPSLSLFLLEPIDDLVFPLRAQEPPAVLDLILVVHDSPEPVIEQNDPRVE